MSVSTVGAEVAGAAVENVISWMSQTRCYDAHDRHGTLLLLLGFVTKVSITAYFRAFYSPLLSCFLGWPSRVWCGTNDLVPLCNIVTQTPTAMSRALPSYGTHLLSNPHPRYD